MNKGRPDFSFWKLGEGGRRGLGDYVRYELRYERYVGINQVQVGRKKIP